MTEALHNFLAKKFSHNGGNHSSYYFVATTFRWFEVESRNVFLYTLYQ